MEPDLDIVRIRRGESFAAWSCADRDHAVRRHFHPEYKRRQVVATNINAARAA